MRTSGTNISATGHKAGLGNVLYDKAGARPDLDLDFARNKSLKDRVSKEDLVTFTRSTTASGSYTGATYVDEKGYINRAGSNLVKYSQDFSQSDWIKANSTFTSNNVVAPDGTLTAGTWSEDAIGYGIKYTDTSNNGHWLIDPSSTSTSSSVPLGGSFANLAFPSDGSWIRGKTYPFTVPTTNNQTLTLYILFKANARNIRQAIPIVDNKSYVYSAWFRKDPSTGKIYTWGVQLEPASNYPIDSFTSSLFAPDGALSHKFHSEYIKTTTQPNSAPRFTHDPVTLESKGLLIEQESKNLCNSDVFEAAFSPSRVSYNTPAEQRAGQNTDGVVSPDGTSVGVGKLYYTGNETVPNGPAYIYAKENLSPNLATYYESFGTHTSSVFIKPGLETKWKITAHRHYAAASADGPQPASNLNAEITLTGNGTVDTMTSGLINCSIQKYPNGWYRVSLTYHRNNVAQNQSSVYGVLVWANQVGTYNNFTSNTGLTSGTLGYVWGAQVEEGSFSTSLIPIVAGSKVTRSPDLASIEGDNFGTYRQNIHSGVTPNLMLDDGVTGNNTVQIIQNATLTPYASLAPDGTFSAVKFQDIQTSSSAVHQLSYNLEANNTSITIEANKTYTVTVHFKAGTATKAGMWLAGPDWASPYTPQQTIDLSTGTLLGTTQLISNNNATVTSVGNGWYRMSMRCTTASSLSPEAKLRIASVNPASGATAITYSGTPAGYFYVWGIQIEEGTSVTPYIPSTDKFTNRQSNATFVDGNGIIRTSHLNLLKHSEDISNTTVWVKGSNTYITTNNTIAPDGTNTADKIEMGNIGSTYLFQRVTLTVGETYTASVYVKSIGTSTNFNFHVFNSGYVMATWIVSNTTTPTEWTRYQITFTAPSSSVDIGFNNHSDNWDTNAYVWGFQLVRGTEAGDYYKTTGTASGPPRYSHDPETLTPTGLYLEPEIDNKATTTETFTDPNYLYTDANNNSNANTGNPLVNRATDNSITNPDGTTGTVFMTALQGDLSRLRVKGIRKAVAAYATQTLSCFVKKKTNRYVALSHGGTTQYRELVFDFDTETITTNGSGANFSSFNADFVKYPNGWYRLVLHTTGATGGDGFAVHIPKDPATSKPVSSGTIAYDGTESVYIWGLNCCDVGFLSTYIPNTTTSEIKQNPDTFTSTATEVLDRANGTKPAFYTKNGLSFFTQGTYTHDNIARRFFEFRGANTSQFSLTSTSSSTNPRMGLFQSNATLTDSSGNSYTSGLGASASAPAGDTTSDDKFAARFEFNNSRVFRNGTEGNLDQTCDTRSSNELYIGNWDTATPTNHRFLGGTIQRLTFWKTPFVDSKLDRLTS